jgi:hypothetical protein
VSQEVLPTSPSTQLTEASKPLASGELSHRPSNRRIETSFLLGFWHPGVWLTKVMKFNEGMDVLALEVVTALMTDTGPGKLTTLPFYFSRKNTQKLD